VSNSWVVMANRSTNHDDWFGSVQLPTFELNGGIVNFDQAARIAADILGSDGSFTISHTDSDGRFGVRHFTFENGEIR
jgi:hypothetical protein